MLEKLIKINGIDESEVVERRIISNEELAHMYYKVAAQYTTNHEWEHCRNVRALIINCPENISECFYNGGVVPINLNKEDERILSLILTYGPEISERVVEHERLEELKRFQRIYVFNSKNKKLKSDVKSSLEDLGLSIYG